MDASAPNYLTVSWRPMANDYPRRVFSKAIIHVRLGIVFT
jgi:hypothetical protein